MRGWAFILPCTEQCSGWGNLRGPLQQKVILQFNESVPGYDSDTALSTLQWSFFFYVEEMKLETLFTWYIISHKMYLLCIIPKKNIGYKKKSSIWWGFLALPYKQYYS